MTRFEYIAALRTALEGLPPEVVERTVAACEQRIHDASAAGQSEEDILASLEDPQQVAADLHAAHAPKLPAVVVQPNTSQAQTPPSARGPVGALRMFFSLIGLMIFNLFLIGPAIAYCGLLIGAFGISLACYTAGIAITGASISGVNQVSLAGPIEHVTFDKPEQIADARHHDGRTSVEIGEKGIHVEAGNKLIHVVPASMAVTQAAPASVGASASTSAGDHDTVIDIGPNKVIVKDGGERDVNVNDDDEDVDLDLPGVHVHHRGLDVDDGVVSLGTDFISESQPVQVGIGIGIILAGVLGFLICLTILRFTWMGVLKLAQLEFAVLRGA